MGKMSEIDYEIRSGSRLVHDLRCYPEHYEAAHQAANRIEKIESALRRMVEWAEDHGLYADEEAKLHPVFTNARAALEGKDE